MTRPLCMVTRRVFLGGTAGAFLWAPHSAGAHQSSGSGLALLVGIGSYPVCANRDKPGPLADVETMRLLLTRAGFAVANNSRVRIRTNAQATLANLQADLALLSEAAQSGETVFFYFAGRGSVGAGLPGAGEENLVPTLATYDALPSAATQDLTLDYLGGWADTLVSKGARPVVLIDTSFYRGGSRDIGQRLEHDPEPRQLLNADGTALRAGTPRLQTWQARGIYLGATGPGGAAYEVMPEATRAAGLFTHVVASRAAWLLRAGKPVTIRDLSDTYAAHIAQNGWTSEDVLPVTIPANAPGYDEPFLSKVSPVGEDALTKRLETREVRRRELRVAIQVRGPKNADAQLNAAQTSAVRELQNALPASCRVRVLTGSEADRERVVSLTLPTESETKWRVAVAGMETDKQRNLSSLFDSQEAAWAFLTGEVAQYLRLQGLVKQLFLLSGSIAAKNGLPVQMVPVGSAKADSKYKVGDKYKLTAIPPADSLVLVVEQHGSDGPVQLNLPASGREWPEKMAPFAWNIQGKAGVPCPLPSNGSNRITADQPMGRACARIIAVAGVPFALTPPNGAVRWNDEAAWETALTQQIENIVEKLTREPSSTWAADACYEVVP